MKFLLHFLRHLYITRLPNFKHNTIKNSGKRRFAYFTFVLEDSNGDVAYYGKLADCANASAASGTNITIPLTGVADGSYTLSVFSEQIAGSANGDFASTPIKTTIEVKSGTDGWTYDDGVFHVYINEPSTGVFEKT